MDTYTNQGSKKKKKKYETENLVLFEPRIMLYCSKMQRRVE